MRMLLLAVLVALSGPADAAERLPKDMLGQWASDPAACGEQASELGLTVEPRAVLFYEHGYVIKGIARRKDGSLNASGYSVDDQGRAPGSIVLKLTGGKLEAGGQIYHRCKGADRSGSAR